MNTILRDVSLCYRFFSVSEDFEVHNKLILLSKSYYWLQTTDEFWYKTSCELGEMKAYTNKGGWQVCEYLVAEVKHSVCDAPTVLVSNGFRYWHLNGLLHRYGDKPAVTGPRRTRIWYSRGKVHREGDRPALISKGVIAFFKDNVLHRDGDQPAYITDCGLKIWFKYGKVHRDGDKPAWVEPSKGKYYIDGKLNRVGGLPTVIALKYQSWHIDGKLSRTGGLPAFVHTSGERRYYIDGLMQREGDLPTAIMADGERRWYKGHKLHRDGGLPVVIKANGEALWCDDDGGLYGERGPSYPDLYKEYGRLRVFNPHLRLEEQDARVYQHAEERDGNYNGDGVFGEDQCLRLKLWHPCFISGSRCGQHN